MGVEPGLGGVLEGHGHACPAQEGPGHDVDRVQGAPGVLVPGPGDGGLNGCRGSHAGRADKRNEAAGGKEGRGAGAVSAAVASVRAAPLAVEELRHHKLGVANDCPVADPFPEVVKVVLDIYYSAREFTAISQPWVHRGLKTNDDGMRGALGSHR